MNDSLPRKGASPTSENVRILEAGLTAVMAGHPEADNPWRFYEVLDSYLGPWGEKGYPIAYGKRYCVAFTTNEALRANPITKEWVWRTTIALQEVLKQFVVEQFKEGRLGNLTEAELRTFAFDSHPLAYTRGGLTLVVMAAPELLEKIVGIPKAEFRPLAPNFGPSICQFFHTGLLFTAQVAGAGLAVLAGPAHTGLLSHAARKDRLRMSREIQVNNYLGDLKLLIEQGNLDDLVLLEEVITRLRATEFPDKGFANYAKEGIGVARQRQCALSTRYKAKGKDMPLQRMIKQLGENCVHQ